MAFGRAVLGLLALALLSAGAEAADPAACRLAPRDGRGSPSDVLQRLVSRAELQDQRGLGGTGVIARADERGLGGTGIIGVVTGFASVCVNGYEVEIDRKTEVTVEGVPAKRADVQLGQVVEIEAYRANDTLVAASIAVRVAVAGPVERISDDRQTLVVAGQDVSVAGFGPTANIPRLRTGDWVAVSGLRRADGSIVGSAITRLSRGQRVLVSGELQPGDNGKLRLGGLAIDATGLEVGQRVVVRGDLAAATLVSRETRVDLASPFSTAVRAVSVQADAARVEAELSRVSGTAVRLNEDVMRNAARAGEAVQADGRLDGRAFTAQSVTRPAIPINPDRPLRGMDAPIVAVPSAPQVPNALTPRNALRPDRPGEQRPTTLPDRPLERPQMPQRPDVMVPERPVLPAVRPDAPVRR